MFIVNTETVPGYTITRTLGLVQGTTIRAKNVGRDIGAAFKAVAVFCYGTAVRALDDT